MAKSSSVVELNPESAQALPSKPRKRRASIPPAAGEELVNAASFPVKPLLIGLGVGAAIATTALVVNSSLRGGSRRTPAYSQPTFAGTLAKAALFALARIVVQRAVRAVADKAALKLADTWTA